MIKIGIELNNIVRNINFQMMKYYKKDINPSFDETKVSMNKTSVINDLIFEDKSKKNEFVFIDYPYEIFGCARVMERNLSTKINEWLLNLYDMGDYEVSFFSLQENDLSIPSTYYFLSKIATRIRKIWFPQKDDNVWDKYDIIITTNPNLVNNKPNGDKTVILIKKEDNTNSIEKADYVYETLSNALEENVFCDKKVEKVNLINRIKRWFR